MHDVTDGRVLMLQFSLWREGKDGERGREGIVKGEMRERERERERGEERDLQTSVPRTL